MKTIIFKITFPDLNKIIDIIIGKISLLGLCIIMLEFFNPSILSAQLPIEVGDSCRYFKGFEEPPTNWKDTTFVDTSWLQGPSGFGYGHGDDNTVLSDMQHNYASVYIRKSFNIPNIADLCGVLLEMDYDDGFVAYINGVEAAR